MNLTFDNLEWSRKIIKYRKINEETTQSTNRTPLATLLENMISLILEDYKYNERFFEEQKR